MLLHQWRPQWRRQCHSPTRRAKMRKKVRRVWGKIAKNKKKNDRNLRKEWGKWNSCPPGTRAPCPEQWDWLRPWFVCMGRAVWGNQVLWARLYPSTVDSKNPINMVNWKFVVATDLTVHNWQNYCKRVFLYCHEKYRYFAHNFLIIKVRTENSVAHMLLI